MLPAAHLLSCRRDWSEANEKIALLEKKLEESEATLARKSNDLK